MNTLSPRRDGPSQIAARAIEEDGMKDQREPQTVIREGASLLTLINVFTVEPRKQQELVDALNEATEKTMRHMEGFVSANIHKSYDGTRVVNYAQWRSKKDFDAMRENPEARVHMEACAKLAKFEPILCEVAGVHGK
jgi:quinol monooxygenase YgiN